MKKLTMLLAFVTSLAITGSGFGQMKVKNSENEELMVVDPVGNVSIKNDLTIESMGGTQDDIEPTLIGVDGNGTVVKADVSFLQQGLIYFPVADKVIVPQTADLTAQHEYIANSAVDVETITGSKARTFRQFFTEELAPAMK